MHVLSLPAAEPSSQSYAEPELPGPHRTPTTLSEWADDLRRRWDLHVVGTATTVPVRLLATTHGAVVEFTGTGTRLRLRVHEPSVLQYVALTSDCDCGVHHADPYRTSPTTKVVLDPSAAPRQELVRDGAALYGWTGVRAATLPVPLAAGHLDSMLADL